MVFALDFNVTKTPFGFLPMVNKFRCCRLPPKAFLIQSTFCFSMQTFPRKGNIDVLF